MTMLDQIRARLPEGPHVKTQGIILMVGELEALLEIVASGERVIERCYEAHKRGETFPMDVALGVGRLETALTQLKAG